MYPYYPYVSKVYTTPSWRSKTNTASHSAFHPSIKRIKSDPYSQSLVRVYLSFEKRMSTFREPNNFQRFARNIYQNNMIFRKMYEIFREWFALWQSVSPSIRTHNKKMAASSFNKPLLVQTNSIRITLDPYQKQSVAVQSDLKRLEFYQTNPKM